MLTIKIYFKDDGSVKSIDKDFPIYQGQFNNILLNVFVPLSLLSPSFQEYADPTDFIISPFVAGTSISVGSKSIKRNGQYAVSNKFYVRFVKNIVKDGVSYALFERKMPKEFVTYNGTTTLIFNIQNVKYGEIDTANTTCSTTSTAFTITFNATTLKNSGLVPNITYNYTFTYANSVWTCNGNSVTLSDYGITLTGTPAENDTLVLKVATTGGSVTNIVTSQTCTFDVLPSNLFDAEPEISTSELQEIEALINSLTADKQDKVDNSLITTAKSVVGAINELYNRGGGGSGDLSIKSLIYNYQTKKIYDGTTEMTFASIKALIDSKKYLVEIDNANVGVVLRYFAYENDCLWFLSGYQVDGEFWLSRLTINEDNDVIFNETELQNKLTFDSTPNATSNNPVTSSGIKSYVDTSLSNYYTKTAIDLTLNDYYSKVQQNSLYQQITSVATTSDGLLCTYGNAKFLIPLKVSGSELGLDVGSDNKSIVISGSDKIQLILTSTQTQGTLTDEEYSQLTNKDSNYIETDVDGHIEKYYYQTDADTDGYRIYAHIEYENNVTTIKAFVITISTKSWIIVKSSNAQIEISDIFKDIENVTLFLNIEQGSLSVSFSFNDTVTIDWGDGLTDTEKTHNYAQAGQYIVTIYGLTSIEEFAFQDKTQIAKIALGGITTIGMYAFDGCTNLTDVVIGSDTTTIEAEAFMTCENLKNVYLMSKKVATIETSAFPVPSVVNYTIYVYQEKLETYKTAFTDYAETMKVGDVDFGFINLIINKQDKLVAGSNITISGNTISATGGVDKEYVDDNFVQTEDEELGTPVNVTEVVANPTLSGSETNLTAIEIDKVKYKIPTGSGSATDVQINGASITSGGVANIVTNTAYDSSTNKIATMSDIANAITTALNTDV